MMESKLFRFLTVTIGLMIVGQSLACDGKNKTRIKREDGPDLVGIGMQAAATVMEIAQQGGAVKHSFNIKSGDHEMSDDFKAGTGSAMNNDGERTKRSTHQKLWPVDMFQYNSKIRGKRQADTEQLVGAVNRVLQIFDKFTKQADKVVRVIRELEESSVDQKEMPR